MTLKISSRTQPTTSEMSTQTEAQIEEPSGDAQQITQTPYSFMEGQEHKCDMETVLWAVVKSTEIENYANKLWQDLQKASDQDNFLDGQEPKINIESQMQNQKAQQYQQQCLKMDAHTAETTIKSAVPNAFTKVAYQRCRYR